jgi:glutamate-1-semialdehyde 2,1-aminomutase
VTAGLATLALLDARVYERLEAAGARLEAGLVDALASAELSGVVQRVGSMLTLFFHEGPVRSFRDAESSDTARFGAFHRGLTERGIYWPPSQFEAAFLSAAHTDDDVDRTIAAARDSLRALSRAG